MVSAKAVGKLWFKTSAIHTLKRIFCPPQRQYGLDGSGGYKQQSLKAMTKEVDFGRMQPSEYHRRKADMLESLALGVDDEKTKTSG